MRLKIIHETIYQFDKNVFLEPHYFRFKPMNRHYLRLEEHHFEVSPSPSGMAYQTDSEDNEVLFCWFDGDHHKSLNIRIESIVETKVFNPFNFIIHPTEYQKWPFHYELVLKTLLAAGLQKSPLKPPVIEYCNDVLKLTNHQTIDFLAQITKKIHADFEVENRVQGSPYPPEQTFTTKKGACRDLSWMLIQMLRHLGIAARFTSGYFYIPSGSSDFDLHGWVEAFIPGAGWVGLDPSHGILTGNLHIPVCTSFFMENTMPVTGSIRGDATSKLETNLIIESI